ncbi:MAG: endonuclease, partial [Dehalococcoidia bacterium]|nr:endonuclease [Dehalococcoidia bacterium]
MKPLRLHDWDLDRAAAQDVQKALAPLVSQRSEIPDTPRLIAGVDISGTLADGQALGAVVLLQYPGMEIVEVQTVRRKPLMPYIPGLLSFREIPVLLEAFECLEAAPDLILCDGHGFAHPRRFGLACHLGILLGVPSIGCAKSVLVGKYEMPALEAGATATLVDRGEPVGIALRTQYGKMPVFVSVGHKVDIASAVRWVQACVRRFR